MFYPFIIALFVPHTLTFIIITQSPIDSASKAYIIMLQIGFDVLYC